MVAVKPRKANKMLNDMKLAIEHDGMVNNNNNNSKSSINSTAGG